MKIALLGNCQADPLRHMLYFANSILKITPFNVNNLRNEKEQGGVYRTLGNFDLVISQVLKKEFGVLSSESVRASFPNVLLVPNIFFLGWHPDMTYLGDGRNRILGPSGDMHSVICVLIAKVILDNSMNLRSEKFEDLYEYAFQEFTRLHDSFFKSKENLKKRFMESDLSFTEFEEDVNFQIPFMFTHNHPMNRAFLGISRQILKKISFTSTMEFQELIDYSPNPLANSVIWSPLIPHLDYSSRNPKGRSYYIGKGRFLNNREFVDGEISLLTKLEQIPPIRRPDISSELISHLSQYINKFSD